MAVILIRIDDRLIHGQVIQGWVKQQRIQKIFVCNDEVAADEMRRTLLEIAVPSDIKISILSINEVPQVIQEAEFTKERVLFLFTKPRDLVRLYDSGVRVKSVNIGAMHFSPGKKHILETISVDEDDVLAFKYLSSRGIELEVRTVPTDAKKDIMRFLE